MFLQSPNHDLSNHFLAFGNPTRLRILERLGKVGVRMSQPRISWHLRTLRVGGIIRTRRDGRQVYCSLDVENIARMRVRLDQLLGITDRMKVQEEVRA